MNSREPGNISFKGGHISAVSNKPTSLNVDNFQINFNNVIAFPGLINSHDHLDFNCFSPLGKRIYSNYTEWGNYIHKEYKQDINSVLRIPIDLRATWGMYKNLLCGITTVINHGPVLEIKDPLISIRQDFQNLHSVKFEKGWIWKLNNLWLRKKRCIIHTGEGSDIQSSEEIDKLLKWNLFRRPLIGIHGVAMNEEQAKKFVALVWCPESNKVLLNKSANISSLKDKTRIVFGTDSTLTGNWNIWNHLRLARLTKQVNDSELYEMISRSPCKLWHVNSGDLRIGKKSNIVIAKNKGAASQWDNFYLTDPEDILMVIHKGNIRLFDGQLSDQLKQMNFDMTGFFPITINGICKFVEGDLPRLMADIKKYYPQAVFPCSVHDPINAIADA
ncbi:MAG: amidohydrolase family protein [Ferruginibacter sp.]